MVEQAGIDPFWFGIFVVIVVEMSQIPFFLLLMVALVIIVLFPSVVTVLPNMMGG